MLTITWLVPLSAWWFGQLFVLSPVTSPAVAHLSLQAVQTVLVAQVLCICLFAPHWIEPDSSIANNGSTVAASLLPAWPLIAVLWLASGVSVAALAGTQLLAGGIGLALILIATGVRRSAARGEMLRMLQTSLGVTAASIAWLLHETWLQWLTR